MITRPLDLQSHLSPAPRDLDFFAWVNVGVIVVFFSLLGSRFILAPVVPIGGGGDTALVLPTSVGAAGGLSQTSVVLSYRRDNVILFEGGVYNLTELRKHLEAYAKAHPQAVMLVRVDRQVSTQAFFELCEAAKQAGFANVVAAAEQPPPDSAPMP